MCAEGVQQVGEPLFVEVPGIALADHVEHEDEHGPDKRDQVAAEEDGQPVHEHCRDQRVGQGEGEDALPVARPDHFPVALGGYPGHERAKQRTQRYPEQGDNGNTRRA